MPRGRTPTIDAAWAIGMKTRDPEKWTDRALAEEITATTGVAVTRQAVSLAIKTYRVKNGVRPAPAWPWETVSRHCRGPMYDLLLAVHYWEKGEPLSVEEEGSVSTFLRMAERTDMVVTYNKRTGFHLVARRPEDSESYFQQRSFDEAGQPILG